MRYIKTYEVVVKPEGQEYSVSDFVNIPYWRYRNSLIDCIMKVEKYSTGKYHGDNSFEFKVLKDGDKFIYMKFKSEDIREFIYLEDPIKIIRPATEEEIEDFKFKEDTKNYNL